MLTSGPSLKNISGLLQKQCGNLLLRYFILSEQYLPYYYFESELPPTKNWMLKLYSYNKPSIASKIRWTPFCFVILPIKAKRGTSFFRSSHLKYFIWSIFLLSKWFPGVFVRRMLSLSPFLMPLGNENGWGYFHNTAANGESFNKSYL